MGRMLTTQRFLMAASQRPWHEALVRLWFVALLLLLALPREASAQTEPTRAQPAEVAKQPKDYSVYVLTFGPGDHPFTKFGHNAIWVHDPRRGKDLVYNFGTFRMSDTIIADFLQGRLTYWLSVADLDHVLAMYKRENRSVVAQELRLDHDQKRDLVHRLSVNALPENSAYKYDYYLDNCSTRVRDVLDAVTGGAVRRAAQMPAEWTWREHTLRLTQNDVLLALGLDAALGPRVDRAVSRFDEMFLPDVLRTSLNATKIGPATNELPLVMHETTLHEAHRPPEPQSPPRWWPFALVIGSFFGAGPWLFVRLARKKQNVGAQRAARAAVWTTGALFGLALGVVGCLLTFFWLATDHAIAQRNENILQLSPFALAFVPLAGWATFSKRADHTGAFVASALGLLALLGWAGKLLPALSQYNAVFVALCVPLWCGLALAFRELTRTERAHRSE